MTVVISGTTGITNDGGYTGDGVVFADTTPANTLVTTTGGNVGVGTSLPTLNTNGTVLHINNSTASRAAIIHMTNAESGSTSADGLICGKWSDGTNYFFDYDSNPIVFGTGGTERARIDSSGRVTTPYQPAFSAYNPAVTGIAAIVVYGLTRTNIGSHYNAATGVYTAPIEGVYVFSFNALMNVDSSYCRLLFRLNGTASTTYGDTLVGGTAGTWNAGWSYLCVGLTWVVKLAQGDTVSVWNDGPTTTYGPSYGTFSGYMLG